MPPETIVGRLRVRSSHNDPLALRLGLTRALAPPLRPTGLAATAILCIRRLHDPLPRAVRAAGSGVSLPPAWQAAVQGRLSELAERAARPARAPVAPDAEAVIFADRAEFLACVAADHVAGSIRGHWWWEELFPHGLTFETFLALWLETPEYVPAALHHLSGQRKALEFVRTLSADQAADLLQRVAVTFGLVRLQASLQRALSGVRLDTSETTSLDIGSTRPAVERDEFRKRGGVDVGEQSVGDGMSKGVAEPSVHPPPARRPEQAPWTRWAPDIAASDLLPVQQTLLATSLLLARSPSEVRSDAFAIAVRRWLQTTSLAARHVIGPSLPFSVGTEVDMDAGSEPQADRVSPDAISGQRHPPRPEPPYSPEKQRLADYQEEHQPIDTPHDPRDYRGGATGEEAQSSRPKPSTRWARASDAEIPPPVFTVDKQIETELGGIFYLINLGLFLGLYADFTSPTEPGISLSIWDFLYLLGRRLVIINTGEDPLWALLAALAGRHEDEDPGRGFSPPNSWRMPVEWLASFPESGALRWAANHGRLRVLHSAGFPILDVPVLPGPPHRQVQLETLPYGSVARFELQESALPLARDLSPLQRWLGWLAPYTQARLVRALGLEPEEDLSETLFRRRARVILTLTHLDVRLELAQLPIAVRLAGLDRDPGWVPAAGRVVSFHFE